MLTVKRRPMGVPTVFNVFDDLFTHSFPTRHTHTRGAWVPAVNLHEHEQGFTMEFAAPGFEKSDFKVQIEKDSIKISARKETSAEATEKKYARKEFSFTAFERSFLLPESVDTDKISATYTNGILTVELPKRVELTANDKKQIEIK